MEKKNILIIPPFNPYPLTSGGHQAIFNGIAILKDIANVYVLVDTTESKWKRGEGKEIEKVLPFVKAVPFIDPASRHTFKWYCRVLWNKITAKLPKKKVIDLPKSTETKPSICIQSMNKYLNTKREVILQAINEYHIDIVQVEMAVMIRAIDFLPETVKRVFVHHELKYVRDELQLKNFAGATKDDWKSWEEEKKEEIRLLNMYDEIITLSSIDTQKLIEAGVNKPITTSLAVVSNAIKPINQYMPVKKVLSYVGPEDHFPNYDGVMWFLKNCWNKLIEFEPKYQFQIIGKWTAETATRIAQEYKGVTCVGYVEDLAASIAGTTMVVPLNIGSGIRMKILEAARIGVPVVATPVGAEGLPLEDGKHAYITADPSEFVEDIISLQDENLREKFIKNTRDAIADKYSMDALLKSRINSYK